VVAVDRSRQGEGFNKERLCVLRRVAQEKSSEHAAGLEDGGVGGAGAVADAVFVDVSQDADEGFEAEADVDGVKLEPLLNGLCEGGGG